jgi:hypothetical protein
VAKTEHAMTKLKGGYYVEEGKEKEPYIAPTKNRRGDIMQMEILHG